jgi:uncharacterized protein (DUF305 family)
MKNKSNTILVAIVAVVAIVALSAYAINRNNNHNGMMSNVSNPSSVSKVSNAGPADVNSADYKQYVSLVGDDYDRNYLANMIEHHQGALDMAELALTKANHAEIKFLAKSILTSQTAEIVSMSKWQKDWAYPASSGAMMMDHSSMGMADSMGMMTQSLRGLSGEAFDKAFLSSMIEHHQSAINMSVSGKANAKHQELKDLTTAIVDAQSKEITQMKSWQKAWGY